MRLLTVRQAATRLTISTRKAYNLVEMGKLPHYRIDNAIRIAEDDVEDFLTDCRVARQPLAVQPMEESASRAKKPRSAQPPVKSSHLRIGPRQLALLRRGGVGTSAPNGRSDG